MNENVVCWFIDTQYNGESFFATPTSQAQTNHMTNSSGPYG